MKFLLPLLGLALAGCQRRGQPNAPAVPPPGGSDLTALLIWVIAAAIVGIGLSIAALVWLPTKKLALSSAAGFAGMLGVALTVKVAQPYMGWVVLAGFVICAIGAIYLFRKWVLTGKSAIAFGCDVAEADPERIELVKARHMAKQQELGIHGLIESELKKLKAE